MKEIVRQEDRQRLNNYDDLKTMRIGVVNGYAYFPRFDKDTQLDKIQVQVRNNWLVC